MSRALVASLAAFAAFASGAVDASAQGLVTMQKLSASLANERVAPLPNVTYAVGGVTIKAGETAIGAIGVSGAPGGQFDEECARAALAKIKDKMK